MLRPRGTQRRQARRLARLLVALDATGADRRAVARRRTATAAVGRVL